MNTTTQLEHASGQKTKYLPLTTQLEHASGQKKNISTLNTDINETASDRLVFFENELDFQFFNTNNYKKIYCILLANDERQVKLGNKVLKYKKNLIKNQIQNTGLKIEFIEGDKFIELSSYEKDFDVIYPSVGENMSFLKRILKKPKVSSCN